MPSDTYSSVPSTGKLKLKGVADSRIDKKRKKKRPKSDDDGGPSRTEAKGDGTTGTQSPEADTFIDRSVVLKSLEDEDAQIEQTRKDEQKADTSKPSSEPTSKPVEKGNDVEEMNRHIKTTTELRFEQQRRKRLEEKLKKDGVKTHKQRVEELNRYLSGLSEHHDMPKIGPG